jgi:hypothetical protein
MWFPRVVPDRLEARPTLAQSSIGLRATASFQLRGAEPGLMNARTMPRAFLIRQRFSMSQFHV